MQYDQRLISFYQIKYYQKLLAEESYLSLLRNRVSRFNNKNNIQAQDLASIDAFENYIVYMLHSNPNQLNPGYMAKYRDNMFRELEQNPNLIFDSIIFRRQTASLLFTPNQFAKIQEIKNQAINLSHTTYDKIMNNQQVSAVETEVFLRFLITQIENPNPQIQKVLDNMYSILLKNPNHKKLVAKEFILKYSAHLAAKKLSIPEPHVYLSDTNIKGETYKEKNYGESIGNSGIITLNRNLIDLEKPYSSEISGVFKFIQTISHEVKHSAQAFEVQQGTISFNAYEYIKFLLFSSHLSSQEFNEYKANYRHSEIESDANKFGWRFASDLLAKYAPDELERVKNQMDTKAIVTQYNEALANKTDGKKRLVKESYNTKFLNEIISKDPTLIQKYPLLSAIYNANGERKSLLELLESEQKISKNNHNSIELMFYEHFISAFHRNEFHQIIPETLQQEQQFLYFSKIIDLIISEITQLKRSIKIIAQSSEKEFTNVNKVRIERIKSLLGILNENQELITKLREIDLLEGNKRVFGMHYQYAPQFLQSLQKEINDNDLLKDSPIYQELLSIGEVKLDGPRY